VPMDTIDPPCIMTDDVFDDGHLRIEHNSYYVSCDGTVLFLPRKEFLILSRLARRFGRTVPSALLWEQVWGAEETFNAGLLRVYVCQLRRKLTPFGLTIRNLTSVGYCLLPARQLHCQPV
jgi:DNA-binding response OmpR family regulator